MKTEIILLLGAGFYIADTLHDGKYSSQFVKYKKHFKIVTILFVVFSIYTFIKKNPSESTSIMSHLNGMIKYMPLDKDSRDLITPFLSTPSEHKCSIVFNDINDVADSNSRFVSQSSSIPTMSARLINLVTKSTNGSLPL